MGKIKEDVKINHLDIYPEEGEMLIPFLSGFDISFGRKMEACNTKLSVYILNPEDFIKEGFGFSNEIMMVYTPYKKTEPRALQAAEEFLNTYPLKNRVENLNYFLISENEKIKEWLDEYFLDKQESRILVPFSAKELIRNKSNAWFVRNRLSENFFGRDLFGYTLPLKEDTYFFGRQQIVANYLDSIKRSENRGIFGLRKTGKTSFLFKIQRIIKNKKIGHVFFYDCKSPSLRKLKWNEFLGEICRNIAQRLSISIRNNFDEINIIKTFRHVLKVANYRKQKIILIFDEVEYVSFKSLTDEHWHSDFIEFWQTMWAAQSVHRNLVYLIAGVNPTVVEVDKISGIQNPLFGIVQYEYLKGLSFDELKVMIKTLGKRMGLRFEHNAIEYLSKWYGGHPLLTRLACSWINKDANTKKNEKPIVIEKEELLTTQPTRDSDLVFYCKHVVSELQDFYPDEYEMLELLASEQISDFVELSSQQEFTKHLESYGLVAYDNYRNPRIAIPVIGRYVGIELARKEGRRSIIKIIEPEIRYSWLEQRKMAILRDLRILEKLIQNQKIPSLFGPNSFPEADVFNEIKVVNSKNDFTAFINTCNRCFVESIENYGKSKKDTQYFWSTIEKVYEGLFFALDRIKTYRNEQNHLALNENANKKLLNYLNFDLENQKPGMYKELYFVLQQRVIDGLLTGIHIETNKLN